MGGTGGSCPESVGGRSSGCCAALCCGVVRCAALCCAMVRCAGMHARARWCSAATASGCCVLLGGGRCCTPGGGAFRSSQCCASPPSSTVPSRPEGRGCEEANRLHKCRITMRRGCEQANRISKVRVLGREAGDRGGYHVSCAMKMSLLPSASLMRALHRPASLNGARSPTCHHAPKTPHRGAPPTSACPSLRVCVREVCRVKAPCCPFGCWQHDAPPPPESSVWPRQPAQKPQQRRQKDATSIDGCGTNAHAQKDVTTVDDYGAHAHAHRWLLSHKFTVPLAACAQTRRPA